MEAAAAQAQAQKERADKDLARGREKAKSLEGRMEQAAEELGRQADLADLAGAADNCESQIREQSETLARLEEQIAGCRKKIERRYELDELIPLEEERLSGAETKLRGLEQDTASLNASAAALSAQVEELNHTLAFPGEREAKEHLERLLQEASALAGEQKKAQEACQQARVQKEKLKGQLVSLKEQEARYEGLPADEELLAEKSAADEAALALDTKSKQLHFRLETNRAAARHIGETSKKLSALEGRLGWMKALSDTAAGALSGKEKIALETYVQASFFEQVIGRANTRFMVMSDGKYELKRAEQASNIKSQGGLELDVIDHYDGSVRSVRSLSGGEKFLASLSLALGLSDEIQSLAGGIQMDSMFIDEGFGSLDSDTLELAMKAFAGLSQSNRLVGIISHVEELKKRIDRQIVVTRENGAAGIEII